MEFALAEPLEPSGTEPDRRRVRRECPLCRCGRVSRVQTPRKPSILRCVQCGLLFREVQVDEVTDQHLGPAELEWLAEARRRMYLRGLATLASDRHLGRLLDVGSGYGAFVELARTQGWKAVAVEPSPYLCRVARESKGLEPVRARAEALPVAAGIFDVVTLWDVLDHVDSPLRALQEARRALRPGGLIHLRLRNGPVHLTLRRLPLLPRSASVVHNQLFSPSTARLALEMAGFVEIRSTPSPLTTGDPYSHHRPLPRALLQGVKLCWAAFAAAASVISGGGWIVSPSLQVTARRPAA